MWNFLRSKKVSAEVHEDEHPKKEEAVRVHEQTQQAISSSEGKKKKVVRFRSHEDEELREEENKSGGGKQNIYNITNHGTSGGDSRSNGVVKIKLVLTRAELKQVMNYMSGYGDDHSSVQHLLRVIKSKGRKVSEAENNSGAHKGLVNGSWKPILETIPED